MATPTVKTVKVSEHQWGKCSLCGKEKRFRVYLGPIGELAGCLVCLHSAVAMLEAHEAKEG